MSCRGQVQVVLLTNAKTKREAKLWMWKWHLSNTQANNTASSYTCICTFNIYAVHLQTRATAPAASFTKCICNVKHLIYIISILTTTRLGRHQQDKEHSWEPTARLPCRETWYILEYDSIDKWKISSGKIQPTVSS